MLSTRVRVANYYSVVITDQYLVAARLVDGWAADSGALALIEGHQTGRAQSPDAVRAHGMLAVAKFTIATYT